MKNLERFQMVFLVAGVGFFILSFVGMGLAPWTTLKRNLPTTGFIERTPLENEGRKIYMNEGCWHCHSQFVRPVAGESLRYGPVSSAMEYMKEIPQLFGTRRVGPDLAREAGKRTDDWHYAHLYNPRSTAPWSVMSPFPWYFKEENGALVPTEKGKALVAYIQSLGAGVKEEMQKEDAEYAKGFKVGSPPALSTALMERGEKVFMTNCSGCHGATGDGNGLAKSFLIPPAEDLTAVHPTPEYVFGVLNRGIQGTAMPHFRDSPPIDLWGVAYYVSELSKEVEAKTTPAVSKETLNKAKRIYKTTCAICHGAEGRGDGPVGLALQPSPPDFQGLRPGREYILKVLDNGVPGTAMPPFPQLSAEEKQGLAEYLQTLP